MTTRTSIRSCACAVLLIALSLTAGGAPESIGRHAGRNQHRVAAPGELPPPAVLAETWDREHLPLPPPPLLGHADVVEAIHRMVGAAPDLFSSRVLGRSVEGRDIRDVWFGRGSFVVLLWSQMHGDEPTATVAPLDLMEYVRRHRDEPPVRNMLDRLTVHLVPMLNPDGAARRQRRNAQGLDLNRDALGLQSPEARLLKMLRDRLQPSLAFNLHNQNWRTSVGRPPRPAAISLLAVAYDEARSEHEGRRLAKRVCAVLRDAIEPLAPGMIGRYDDEFEAKAFGDNITKWGTPVVLVETGPYPSREPDAPLVRINFAGLLTALDALATDRARDADPNRYEQLPQNDERLFFALVSHGSVLTGTGVLPFIADVGIGATRVVTERDGVRRMGWSARIEDLGDLRVFGALETIDATGRLVAPLHDPSVKPGDLIRIPTMSTGVTLAVGQPGNLVVLSPASGGRYRVERTLVFDR